MEAVGWMISGLSLTWKKTGGSIRIPSDSGEDKKVYVYDPGICRWRLEAVLIESGKVGKCSAYSIPSILLDYDFLKSRAQLLPCIVSPQLGTNLGHSGSQ